MIFHKLMQSEGLSVGIGKDIMTEVVAPGQIPMMIEYDESGMIAGYIVAEPFGTKVVDAGLGNVLKLSKEIWPGHPCCTVVARDDLINKSPEAVQEIVSSFVASGKEVKTDRENTIKVAMEFLGQEEAVVRAILEDPNERVTTDKLLPNIQELKEIQDYLIDKVSVPAISGKIDMEKFVDLRFATAAGAQ
jgi:NitT/TauT family transport system substrate-binding protein